MDCQDFITESNNHLSFEQLVKILSAVSNNGCGSLRTVESTVISGDRQLRGDGGFQLRVDGGYQLRAS